MIDKDGFRRNVGIIVINNQGLVLWAKRFGSAKAWQFPQGGTLEEESAVEAMYRELKEELGLDKEHVNLIAESKKWVEYRLPFKFQRKEDEVKCIGQRQKWFLLKLNASEQAIQLDASTTPEFDQWKWVPYWQPLKEVIFFKRHVYREVLREFEGIVKRLQSENSNAS